MVEKILSDGSFYPPIPSLCNCGCNEIVWGGREYVLGHNSRKEHPLKQHSYKTKKQISNSLAYLKEKIYFIPTLCKCGCNETIWKRGNEFINGHYYRGKKFSIKHKENMSLGMKEKTKGKKRSPHSELHKRRIGNAHKGIPKTESQKEKISRTRKEKGISKGKNNPNWKGGINSVYSQIRCCEKYSEWRSLIFIRDNFTCQECNKLSSGDLEAHHIKFFNLILKENNITSLDEALQCTELWNINNGVTLCKKCHNRKPKN